MRLSMQSILIGAALVAALLILVRIIWGSPLVARIRENFGNTTQGNTVTMCPEGTTMIMWDARAYCCGGKINTDTDRVDKVCTPITSDPAAPPPVFCTLDGKTEHVPNCHTIRTDMLMKSGASHCPHDAPNFVQGLPGTATERGRCCAGLTNEGRSDCLEQSAWNCDVTGETNWFKTKEIQSCQYRKAQESTTCPQGYGRFTMTNNDMTIFGCANGGSMCYAESTLQSLRGMGVDTTGMVACKT